MKDANLERMQLVCEAFVKFSGESSIFFNEPFQQVSLITLRNVKN